MISRAVIGQFQVHNFLYQCMLTGISVERSNLKAWLTHYSEISTNTSTNVRHTHAQKWLGSWMTDSARAIVLVLVLISLV